MKINKFLLILMIILGLSQLSYGMHYVSWAIPVNDPGKDSWRFGDKIYKESIEPINFLGIPIADEVHMNYQYWGIADQVTDTIGSRIELRQHTKIILGALVLASPILAAFLSK